MKEFLRQVAEHYYAGGSISRLCFIFPNKRAEAFFGKYLAETASGTPLLMPLCFTMNDFFYSLTNSGKTDRIQLLVKLYECYRKLNQNAEPLDDFLYWGGVMLADFEDVDKYLADPSRLFSNVTEFRQMQDLSYLSDEQRNALERFLGHFTRTGEVKEKFLQVWNILLPLYRNFRSELEDCGLSYEGMVYRTLAEKLEATPVADLLPAGLKEVDNFVFVGLNALNECEKRLLGKMRNAGLARFCWDWCSPEIQDPVNKSSFFMAGNVAEFPQAFKPDIPQNRPKINVLSVPSAIGQAKQVPAILAGRVPGIETAVVLPDESLLPSVLESIPGAITDLNVTMGYPVRGSEWMGLIEGIANLQLNIKCDSFYHRPVWALFSNSILRSLMTEKEKETAAAVRKEARYYIPESQFKSDGILGKIFVVATNLAEYLKEIILFAAHKLRARGSDASMELEFAMFSYKTVTRLESLNLDVKPATWLRLLEQFLQTDSVPFKGEPLCGLQIMGPLETRALDFQELMILSCNEGIFPRRSVGASFIPPELRKGFGLPTYEFQDAVWAYYFYRLIQRASTVWLVFDSRMKGVKSGEESRYIKQLEMLYPFNMQRFVVNAPIVGSETAEEFPKTAEDMAVLKESDFRLSATAMRSYIQCPAQFCYAHIKKLKPADEVEESLDAGMIGNALHFTMHALYSQNPHDKKMVPLPEVSREYLRSTLKDKEKIRGIIRSNIMEQMKAPEITGRNLIWEELIFSCVQQILRRDLGLLESKGLPGFKILGLEEYHDIMIDGYKFVGYIDRLDSFDPGTVRVVDYKTGHVTDEEMNITDENAPAIVDKLFGDSGKDRPGIALQLYLYDILLSHDNRVSGKVLHNAIYHTSRLFIEEAGGTPASAEFSRLTKDRLSEKLAEISDRSRPWKRNFDEAACSYCDFRKICGR